MSLILKNKYYTQTRLIPCPTDKADGLRRASMFQALCENHDRLSKDNDVRMVKYAFLIMSNTSYPELDYADRLKSLMRIYLNRYRRRHSGKKVLGYSWVLNIESSTALPYLHVIFYVSKETYDDCPDEIIKSDVDKKSSELRGFWGVVNTPEEIDRPDSDYNDIADLGRYWLTVCESEGFAGAVVSYNHDKGRYILSHGEHPYLQHLKNSPLLADLNGSNTFLSKITVGDIPDGHVLTYFRILSREALLIPKERSYGVSHKPVK